MKIITFYELIIYTDWWNEYNSKAFNSLEEAQKEMKKSNYNAIVKKRKKIIWGKIILGKHKKPLKGE